MRFPCGGRLVFGAFAFLLIYGARSSAAQELPQPVPPQPATTYTITCPTNATCVLVKSAASPPAVAQPSPDLPQFAISSGTTWTRGAAHPYSFDFGLAVRIAATRFFSWTDVSTPLASRTVPGGPPATSTFTTGGAYVPWQSADGRLSLIFIATAGFTSVQANSGVSPQFTGLMAFTYRIGKTGWYVMADAKAVNATTSTTSGALATAVLQPGIRLVRGFFPPRK